MAKLVLRNFIEGGSQGAALPSLLLLEPWVMLCQISRAFQRELWCFWEFLGFSGSHRQGLISCRERSQQPCPCPACPQQGSMSWGTASGSKTLVKEMWASSVLKVTHCGGSWQHCLGGGEGHVCVEAVGFVCCHLLLPSEFSQFESRGILKVEAK